MISDGIIIASDFKKTNKQNPFANMSNENCIGDRNHREEMYFLIYGNLFQSDLKFSMPKLNYIPKFS